MSFDLPKSSYADTLGFRIGVGYSLLLVVSFVFLAQIAYIFLGSNLERQDREQVQQEVTSLRNEYSEGGRAAFDERVRHNDLVRKNNPFFTRILAQPQQGQGEQVFFPQYWEEFDLEVIDRRGFSPDHWVLLPSTINPYIFLEIYSTKMPDGFRFQVGISTADRKATLARFRETSLFAALPLLVLCLVGGAFLSWHFLRPIRHLIETVSQVRAGDMSVRAPRSYSGDELDRLGGLFNDMIERLNKLLLGMRHALDAIGHDLRTPMTRFRNRMERALQVPAEPEQYRQTITVALEESERILTLLNTLLDLTEAEAGTLRLNVEDADVVALVSDLVEMYGVVAEEKGVSLHLQTPGTVHAPVDRVRFSQAIANLLDNAIKYTPSGGEVWLKVVIVGAELQLVVADSGVGIDPEDLEQVWERLYRGRRGVSKGLGLGLSLVRAIAEAHAGKVAAENRPEGGAVFSLSLPLHAVTNGP